MAARVVLIEKTYIDLCIINLKCVYVFIFLVDFICPRIWSAITKTSGVSPLAIFNADNSRKKVPSSRFICALRNFVIF